MDTLYYVIDTTTNTVWVAYSDYQKAVSKAGEFETATDRTFRVVSRVFN